MSKECPRYGSSLLRKTGCTDADCKCTESSSGPGGYVPEFSQGVCADGAAILKDGQPMTVEQILSALRALAFLAEIKAHKDKYGKDEWYSDAQPIAWDQAKEALST
ncbi:MAG: hypothetical protein AB2747_05195 [Candidatus Thiodiazotropha taylori]